MSFSTPSLFLGVAVDIGSMFDKWAGKVTRGENRSPIAVGNTYKL